METMAEKQMHPIRRILSSSLGLVFLVVGGYMFYGLFFLGFGGKYWMYVSSALGVLFGGYMIWEDGLSPLFTHSRERQSHEEEFASNLYDSLVLSGGPSADNENHLDAGKLDIPLSKLERFASKRLIMLEAFLFVATNIATMREDSDKLPVSTTVHPLAVQMSRHLQNKWAERGIKIANHFDVGERCFEEVEEILEKPFNWGRAWLDEFYDDPEISGEHYILWTDQCLKEFETMKMVVRQYV